MIDERVGPNFWLSELLHSEAATRLGLDNWPDAASLGNLRNLAGPGIQRVRDLLGVPVIISSGYRGPALNRHIGGSTTSQHMQGLAIDFTAPAFGTPRKVCQRIMEQVAEGRFWVHTQPDMTMSAIESRIAFFNSQQPPVMNEAVRELVD